MDLRRAGSGQLAEVAASWRLPEGVPRSGRRAMTPAGQPPGRRRYSVRDKTSTVLWCIWCRHGTARL